MQHVHCVCSDISGRCKVQCSS